MKKLMTFIVKRRLLVLIMMMVVTIGSILMIPNVVINTDMTKYLPDSSQMKKGLELMEEAFPENEEEYSVRVMFEDLIESEKIQVLAMLEAENYVDSVDYEVGSEDYNKDSYTLYVVNTQFDYYSDEEKLLEQNIADHFAAYDIKIRNNDMSTPSLPPVALGAAFTILMVILFLMTHSYAEPILFLIAIGMAIVINMGTNILLGEVSDVTYGIASILQLVLSMDYSIILMNRYRQERLVHENRDDAMVAALTNGFSSIASSSVTTIVGLLMMVFMSFKIGADLGLVLAKGVLLSMLVIFIALPGMILIAEPLIQKTKKKDLHIPTAGLARVSSRFSAIIIIIFVVLFAGSFVLQNVTSINYSVTEEDPIAEFFENDNMLVLLYDSEDEEAARNLIKELEAAPAIKNVMGYGNTLDKQYTSKSFVAELSDMTSEMSITPEMLDIIYYDLHKGGDVLPMTVSEFMNFIESDIMNNEVFADNFDVDIADQMTMIQKFTSLENVTKPLTADEMADYFQMENNDVLQLFMYYQTINPDYNPGSMTLSTFINFVKNTVSADPAYASHFDSQTLAGLNQVGALADSNVITMPMNSAGLAKAFSMDEAMVSQLLMMASNGDVNATMSMEGFVNYLLSYVVTNEAFMGQFDPSTIQQLGFAQTIMKASIEDKRFTSKEMSTLMGMDAEMTRQLYTLRDSYVSGSTWTMSASAFIDFLVSNVVNNDTYASQIDRDMSENLLSLKSIVDAVVSQKAYTYTEMAALFEGMSDELDADALSLLYTYYSSTVLGDPEWTLSIVDLFNFISNDMISDPRYTDFIDQSMIDEIDAATLEINDGVAQLKNADYSRIIITTTLPMESDETMAFVEDLTLKLESNFSDETYLIGNSAMNYEMKNTFRSELITITLLTALAIFIVVAIAFRSVIMPLILVLIVQCAVFITVAAMGIKGYSIYFLALLIVQCILMGATIDYGILFSNYYREKRQVLPKKEALLAAYEGSIHTIMTSGLIMILVTFIVGAFIDTETIAQICTTLSIGSLSATLLILFVLPGLLVFFDKWIIKNPCLENNISNDDKTFTDKDSLLEVE